MPDDFDERTTGREAPMVITPRAVVRLARQLARLTPGVVRRAVKRKRV
jgi:hypothetical protein